jgi:hypothetical protein
MVSGNYEVIRLIYFINKYLYSLFAPEPDFSSSFFSPSFKSEFNFLAFKISFYKKRPTSFTFLNVTMSVTNSNTF